MTAKDHYDKHLGNFYSWMMGNFPDKQQDQESFFRKNRIVPFVSAIAFDLGAGHGLQAVSLANLGFSVKAVDFNGQLLTELIRNAEHRNVQIIDREIIDFLKHENDPADVITCMGDTISHFERVEDVEELIQECKKHLVDGGKLILSFRDLTVELTGQDRFIPVKSDENRIATCFLEYFTDRVMVYDILQEKSNEVWHQKVSAYAKLRLNERAVTDMLQKNGVVVTHVETINRMIHIIGEKIH